jgi:type IV pilus biogenesis protein PilP
MSRRARWAVTVSSWLALCGLAPCSPATSAQTIADYSRAQRALLENTMAQAAARSAGFGAPATSPAASATIVAPAPASAPAPAPRLPTPSVAPAVRVSGVFAANNESVAEVVVNATAYLLGTGQGVPGTAWRVESIAIDRVVLTRDVAGAGALDAEGARKVFALPALR